MTELKYTHPYPPPGLDHIIILIGDGHSARQMNKINSVHDIIKKLPSMDRHEVHF